MKEVLVTAWWESGLGIRMDNDDGVADWLNDGVKTQVKIFAEIVVGLLVKVNESQRGHQGKKAGWF